MLSKLMTNTEVKCDNDDGNKWQHDTDHGIQDSVKDEVDMFAKGIRRENNLK